MSDRGDDQSATTATTITTVALEETLRMVAENIERAVAQVSAVLDEFARHMQPRLEETARALTRLSWSLRERYDQAGQPYGPSDIEMMCYFRDLALAEQRREAAHWAAMRVWALEDWMRQQRGEEHEAAPSPPPLHAFLPPRMLEALGRTERESA